MALPETLRQIIDYMDFSAFTMNDWILIGATVVGGVVFLLATNEFIEWKFWRYY
jgi:hypothetical protein